MTVLGLAPLSIAGHPPTTVVEAAADAGFDAVGLRVRPATDTEPRYDLSPGSPLLAQTRTLLADTGLRVLDVEFLVLDALTPTATLRDTWLRMYEAGEALGACTLTVAVSDPDPARVRDHLTLLADDGRPHGIVPTLEPISYQAISTPAQAARVADGTGARVLVDVLHVGRSGGAPADVAAVADAVGLVQLCDGPRRGPGDRAARMDEARTLRLPPGAGELGCAQVLAAVSPDVPVSVEVPDVRRVTDTSPTAWARVLHTAARAVIDEAKELR